MTLKSFLGAGAFGRVYEVQMASGEGSAVKVVLDAQRATAEIDALRDARKQGCAVVV